LTLALGHAYSPGTEAQGQSGNRGSNMAILDEATLNLKSAIERLEAAVDQRKGRASGLEGDLASARQESKQLQDSMGVVSDRLDATITRLKTLLET
jgi:chromosome segregation ATPase